jgi:hypothetical protein
MNGENQLARSEFEAIAALHQSGGAFFSRPC